MRREINSIPQVRWKRATTVAAGGALSLCALIGSASADICVTCASPDASYGCAIDGAPTGADDPRLTLYCIQALAKAGGHAQCSVARAVTAPCAGERRVIAAPSGFGLGEDAVTNADAPVAPTIGNPPPAAAAPPPPDTPQTTTLTKTAPPKTVEEIVEGSAKSAEDAVEKTGSSAADAAKSAGGYITSAGQAVGNAAKKTWTCLSSLFGDC